MKRLGLIVLLTAGLGSCQDSHQRYQEQLEVQLASGERYDSLFLSLHFGMNQKEFYATCWELNRKGLLTQGPSNLSAEYDLNNGELNYPGHLRFYPQFHEDRIFNMPIEIVYEAFIPTDPRFSSDSLLPDVKELMEKWYGTGFNYLEDDEGTRKVYVKVDGNRRIRIFKKDVSTVAVDITDMPVYLALTEENEID